MLEVNIEDIKKAAVIMAGGVGERLWPRSSKNSPKQFEYFYGYGTMIQNTYSRLKPLFDENDIYVVTKRDFVERVKDSLPSLPKENVISEPYGRNTAPCLAMTATRIGEKYGGDAVLAAFPADHVIENVREFHSSLVLACKTAYERDGIVTLGIAPTSPETSFGYVQIKEDEKDLGELYKYGVRYSSAFAEKPDLETAQRFIDSGDFLWNGGIFAMRFNTFWKAFEKFLPEHNRLFNFLKKNINGSFFNDIAEEVYKQITAESVDYAILEKADNVFVVQSTFDWSDLGNWDELFDLSLKDARDNYIEGKVTPINVKNCFISSREKMIGAVNVENLIIVEDERGIIVCKRNDSDSVKKIINFMKRKKNDRYL